MDQGLFSMIFKRLAFNFDPYAAELFKAIFHSFEAGIANAIASSK